ncbi:Cu(I)-responsive transcriptional regulator [Massilia sp. PAMC28688]|uniref:Cu(I)-responsive transcriptional regulator n=1 Tax=Massilia sp. PAMC28688 TaxID=2861283 RepID=UPI001C626FB8|nr:Cu(I)-responsive transcriptional regulator [Massilia sp. PAMC28688]QYF95611.1 Cu(I)-responsive transcriptional regulator [Massilia sp. PAMC28688]
MTAAMEMGAARQQGMQNIGETAKASGVSAKMIRHYEAIGLIEPAVRTDAGYRVYRQRDVDVLRFIHRSRELGFSLEQIKTLLALWRDKQRASKDVRAMARVHIEELDRKIADMQAMKRTLETLATRCHGDERPECPILDDLSLG